MDRETKAMILAAVALLVVFLCVWLVKCSNEARTFNKFRAEGTPAATTWDAMWAELRVEARP